MEQWFTTGDGFAPRRILGWHSGVGVLLACGGKRPGMSLIPHCTGQYPQQSRIWSKPHGPPAAATGPRVCFLFPLKSLSSPPPKPDTAFNSPLVSGKHFFLFIKFHLSGLGSKITVDGDCSHETKIHLLLGRKAMTNLDSIL